MGCGRPGIPLILSTAASRGLIFLPSSNAEISLLFGELVQLLSQQNKALPLAMGKPLTADTSRNSLSPLVCSPHEAFAHVLFLPAPLAVTLSVFHQPPDLQGSHMGRYQTLRFHRLLQSETDRLSAPGSPGWKTNETHCWCWEQSVSGGCFTFTCAKSQTD